jgi:hypothetical protein
MIIKRIFSWSVWMVTAIMATVPAAWAEQPIIVPVIFVVSQQTDRSDVTAPVKLQTAVYRVRAVGKQSSETVPDFAENTGMTRMMKSEVLLQDYEVRRVDLVSLSHNGSKASGAMELNLPVLLKVIIKDQGVTDVSLSCAPHRSSVGQLTELRGPVIPATDLLTGRPTTVRPEYVEEYHRIVRLNSK